MSLLSIYSFDLEIIADFVSYLNIKSAIIFLPPNTY